MLLHCAWIVFHAILWLPLRGDTNPPLFSAGQYDEKLALYLVRISSAMYCPAPAISIWSCVACSQAGLLQDTKVVIDSESSFQGIVGYSADRDAIVIAFRGSSNLKNWIANVKFVKTKAYNDFPEALVHRGFYKLYQKVAAQVLASIQKLRQEHATAVILVTGHSLGGAIASICAFELKFLHDLDAHAVYTFGQPRLGNFAFAQLMNNYVPSLNRVIHAKDVVPHMLPSYLRYYHSKTEVRNVVKIHFKVSLSVPLQIFYGKFFESYRMCSAKDGEDKTCSNVCAPYSCQSIEDHTSYLNVTLGDRVQC